MRQDVANPIQVRPGGEAAPLLEEEGHRDQLIDIHSRQLPTGVTLNDLTDEEKRRFFVAMLLVFRIPPKPKAWLVQKSNVCSYAIRLILASLLMGVTICYFTFYSSKIDIDSERVKLLEKFMDDVFPSLDIPALASNWTEANYPRIRGMFDSAQFSDEANQALTPAYLQFLQDLDRKSTV